MHGGFGALRNSCPMNMSREPSPIDVPAAVHADVARIEQLWSECLEKSGGPFLFGDFTNADAMFAPVVNRLEIYCLVASDAVQQYSNAMKSLEAWKEWEQAGRAETWYVAEDEV
jgi:glutathione S-transferase